MNVIRIVGRRSDQFRMCSRDFNPEKRSFAERCFVIANFHASLTLKANPSVALLSFDASLRMAVKIECCIRMLTPSSKGHLGTLEIHF